MKAKNIKNKSDYNEYVKNLADILIEENRVTENGEIDYDLVWETVDSDRIITHSDNYLKVFKYSDSDFETVKVNDKYDLVNIAFNMFKNDLLRVLRDKLDM